MHPKLPNYSERTPCLTRVKLMNFWQLLLGDHFQNFSLKKTQVAQKLCKVVTLLTFETVIQTHVVQNEITGLKLFWTLLVIRRCQASRFNCTVGPSNKGDFPYLTQDLQDGKKGILNIPLFDWNFKKKLKMLCLFYQKTVEVGKRLSR